MRHARGRFFIAGALLAVMSLVLAGVSHVIAQDEDATPVPDAMPMMAAYPADIHEGNCDDLSPEPVFALADVMMDGALGGTPPAIEVMGADSAIPVAMSVTALDVALDDILAADHAIHVALGPDDHDGPSLVCGDIGGRMVGDNLVVGLQEQDDSGATGIAWLNATAEDQTTVTIFVAQGLAADVPAPTVATPEPIEAEVATPITEVDPATPPPDEVEVATPPPDDEVEVIDATPPPVDPATPPVDVATPPPVDEATPPPDDEVVEDEDDELAEAIIVEAVDIDFNPNQFTIAADTDVPVTLRNLGSIEHTFTIDELDIDIMLAPGEVTEITINAEAGEYIYYCTIPGHREGGQEGTMTVE